MSAKSLRIAILGAGLFATEAHIPALARLTSSTSLVAIYSRTHKSAATLAETAKKLLSLPSLPSVYHDEGGEDGDLNALLARSDIDAVIIALPITIQPEVVRSALSHGKHVLSEKPVAPTVAQGLELIDEYEKQWKEKVVWKVGENLEAEPANRRIGELVREGIIGKVMWWTLSAVIKLDTDSKWYKTPWRTVPKYQGGFVLDGGVHAAAVLRTVLPSPPVSLSGHASLSQKHLAPSDTLTAVSLSADGSHGLFELSVGAPLASRDEYDVRITGSEGWIDLTQTPETFRFVLHTAKPDGENEEVFDMMKEGVFKEIEYFVDAVNGGKDDGIGEPRGALRDVAFIEAGLGSHGEKVDLEKLLREGK